MKRLLLIGILSIAPALLAQHEPAGAAAPHDATAESHATSSENAHGEAAAEHAGKTYFGIPGWILKVANMVLFLGVLIYFVGRPVKKAFVERGEVIRRAADEARDRRRRADEMAGEIQTRLSAIEEQVRAIHERAVAEGARQKRDLIAAAEAEARKIIEAARTEVDTRLKHARSELTEYAGQLASERAEAILREKMTEQDQNKLFEDSLRAVSEVRS